MLLLSEAARKKDREKKYFSCLVSLFRKRGTQDTYNLSDTVCRWERFFKNFPFMKFLLAIERRVWEIEKVLYTIFTYFRGQARERWMWAKHYMRLKNIFCYEWNFFECLLDNCASASSYLHLISFSHTSIMSNSESWSGFL
jgi:hypothetical protein